MRPRCTNEESCTECKDLWFTHCSLNCQLKEHNIRTGKQLCYDRCTVWCSSDWHYFNTFHTIIVTSFIWNNIKSQTGKCYDLVFKICNWSSSNVIYRYSPSFQITTQTLDCVCGPGEQSLHLSTSMSSLCITRRACLLDRWQDNVAKIPGNMNNRFSPSWAKSWCLPHPQQAPSERMEN